METRRQILSLRRELTESKEKRTNAFLDGSRIETVLGILKVADNVADLAKVLTTAPLDGPGLKQRGDLMVSVAKQLAAMTDNPADDAAVDAIARELAPEVYDFAAYLVRRFQNGPPKP